MKSQATVVTTTGGAFSYDVQPRMNTSYEARFKNSTSAPTDVKVRPRMRLRKIARGRFQCRR